MEGAHTVRPPRALAWRWRPRGLASQKPRSGIGALSMVLGVVSEAAFGSSAKLLWQCSWTATCRRLPPTILATIRARSLLSTLNGLACLGQSGPQPTAERTCKDISARTASPLPT
jgi:hypothetical protein